MVIALYIVHIPVWMECPDDHIVKMCSIQKKTHCTGCCIPQCTEQLEPPFTRDSSEAVTCDFGQVFFFFFSPK